MSDLNPEIMSLYSTSAYDSCEDLMKDTGLSNLMSGVTVDAKIFHPCGFSLNAISGVCSRVGIPKYFYSTHVTCIVNAIMVPMGLLVFRQMCCYKGKHAVIVGT